MSEENKNPAENSAENSAPKKPRVSIKAAGSASRKKMVNRKWLIVASALIGGVVVASSLMGGKAPKLQYKAPPEKPIEIVPKNDVRLSFEKQTQSDISQLQTDVKTITGSQKNLEESIKKMHNGDIAAQNDLRKQLETLNGSLASLISQQKTQAVATKTDKTGVATGGKDDSKLPPVPSANLGALPNQPPPPPLPPGAKPDEVKQTNPNDPVVLTPPEAKNDGKVASTSTYVANKFAGYIPTGSFASIVLLTGVEAGTASTSQANPQPVLMRVQTDAVLPGEAGYKVSSCFVTGSSFGSASTQRAYIRTSRLSCVDKDSHLVLDAPLKGYIVDSDGMFGLRGKQVQREGALLAKTMLAGFASGLGTALSGAQGTTTSGVGGVTSMISGSAALRSTGLGGASNAAEMLAKFYLDQAKNIFPVIEVQPKRKGTLVLTEGANLEWSDYGSLYVKKQKPNG